MPPMFQGSLSKYKLKVREQAVKYIKENAGLLNTNIDEFIKNCPEFCKPEVVSMLSKAGIDFHYVSLNPWDIFDHDTISFK